MISKNDIIRVEITDILPDGQGICKTDDGLVLFVKSAAPGEIVDAHVMKVNKSYGYAKVERVITPSPFRISPDCAAFASCGGCVFRHITYEKELEIKKKIVDENFARIGGIDIRCEEIIPSPQRDGYRNKAQYPAALDRDGNVRFGFFSRHSHRVIPCEDCPLQPSFFAEIVYETELFCNEYKIMPYDEQTRRGLIRHLYIRDGRKSGEISVCIVATGNIPHAEALCARLIKKNANIKSIVLNINKKDTNVILGDRFITLWGKDTIKDELCGLEFEISPRSFYQVNHDGAEKLYSLAALFAEPDGKHILDLYCGTGTIGLSMARRAGKLTGVEIIAEAVENAKNNAIRNGISNADFICGDAGGAAQSLAEVGFAPGVVIVDPPRAGCSAETLDAIVRMSPERIVMISCNSASAARDCATLKNYGYDTKRLIAVDMFPRTGHVECVVLMSKK